MNLLYKAKTDLYCCYLFSNINECLEYYNDKFFEKSKITIIDLKEKDKKNKKNYFIFLRSEIVKISDKFKLELANVITSDCKIGWINYEYIEEVK